MRNRGLSRPELNAAICAAMFVGGLLALWWGVSEMNALGYETSWTAASIAIGGLLALFGFLLFFNFMWGVRIVSAMRRGEGVIARWTVSPEAFDQFRAADRPLDNTDGDNDYVVPRKTPSGGVEVIFSADGVLIGDTFFGLATTGLGRFAGVRMRETPASIEFGTIFTTSVAGPAEIGNEYGVLRVPTARDAQEQAAKVLAHYQDVMARRTIVKPNFWRTRIKIGLIGAAIFAVIAVIGFALSGMNDELSFAPLIMAIAGTIFALGGLVLAGIAWLLLTYQHEG